MRRTTLGTVPLVMCRLATGQRAGTFNILSVLIIVSCRELNLSQRFLSFGVFRVGRALIKLVVLLCVSTVRRKFGKS